MSAIYKTEETYAQVSDKVVLGRRDWTSRLFGFARCDAGSDRSPLTYSFSDTLGSVDVNGTITTDAIGVLAAGDIVAYQYTVTGAGAGLPVTVSCPLKHALL